MKKSVMITKALSGFIFMFIIIVSLDISAIFPIGFFRDKLKDGYKFIISHSQSFFFILGVLFVFYLLFDIITILKKYSDDAEGAEKIKKNQINSFHNIDSSMKELEMQIGTAKLFMFKTKADFRSKSQLHLARINNTLNSINTVYDRNLSTYHKANRKLYHIASKTTIYSQSEIKRLIDQYQNIKF